jgi:pilus assembly protein CpaB
MAKKSGAGGIILAAVMLGLVAAYMIYRHENNLEKQNKEHWIPLVVAREDIPARTKITSDMITLQPYPQDLIANGAIQERKEVEGRVTLARLKAKEQIRSSDLAPEGQAPGLSYEIPPGMRAIAIAAGEIMSVGTAVKPGDHVDVLATYSEPNTHQETTRTVLQNVLVLAVNKGETNTQSPTGANTSMTLAVKPEEAELLMAADRASVMRVMLRSPSDKAIVNSPGITVRDFQGSKTFELAPKTSDDQRATPVNIIPPSNRHGSEIMIYRGSQGQAVSTE